LPLVGGLAYAKTLVGLPIRALEGVFVALIGGNNMR